MPRCAGCGKRFKDHARVLRHMNHPRTSCTGAPMVEGLVRASTFVRQVQRRRMRFRQGSKRYKSDVQLECGEFRGEEESEPDLERIDVQVESEFGLGSYTQDPNFNYTMNSNQYGDHSRDDESRDIDLNSGSPSWIPLDSSQTHLPLASNAFKETHPGASSIYGKGKTFMDGFDSDQHADKRTDNIYYPFATRSEWELASWLLRSNLSMRAIDELLSLELISNVPLSFRTAKELRGRAEMLPTGPEWTCKPISTKIPTKSPVRLYLRDPIECLQSLLDNPLLKDQIILEPFRVFKTAEKLARIYTEWMSADCAWEMQKLLPKGATLLGTILSSDKTTISAMTGNRTAYPLLISLANINMSTRMKASHHAFILLALLPVSKFIHQNKKVRGLLYNRLIHQCLDVVLAPLKTAASIGIMMSDPLGQLRYCFTPLASYIVDTPEAQLLAGVGGKTSPLTMASHKHFGDPYQYTPRTAATTLTQIHELQTSVNPWGDLGGYLAKAGKVRLNGVHEPFWRDWPYADPCKFFTPEPLHHWHKQFWDHDAKWCIRAVGDDEIDFRFSILQPRTGFRHFKEGISKVKQVTGREHRDIERYMVGIIADAAPKRFIAAIRALMDFRYLAQSHVIDETLLNDISAALREFHAHKQAILDAGARVGKGNKSINHFFIPKLELLQSVVSNIRFNGVAIQWSADVTEHAHITEIKDPARAGNNQDYDSQICRALDRIDKCRRFDLATAIRGAHILFGPEKRQRADDSDNDSEEDADHHLDHQYVSTTTSLLPRIKPVSNIAGVGRLEVNYFEEAESLRQEEDSRAPLPYRTFSSGSAAFHLTRDPSYKRMTVDDVAAKFQLKDLRSALQAYCLRLSDGDTGLFTIGGRRSAHSDCELPFDLLQVWCRLRIQTKSFQDPKVILPAQTLNVFPPSQDWPFGRYDVVLVNTNDKYSWPESGLSGHHVAQIRLIIRPIPRKCLPTISGLDIFLAYVQRFDFVSLANDGSIRTPLPDPITGMHVLRRSLRADQTRMGDIVPVTQFRAPIPLIPRFGAKADICWTKENSLEHSREFFLNKFFDKDLYLCLRS